MKVLIIHCAYHYKGGEDTVVEEERKLLESEGIEVDTLIFDNSKSVLLNVLLYPFNFLSYFKTRKKIKESKPDVVHIHNLHFAASASVIYAIKSFKIPCVITLHNFRLLCPSATLFHGGKIFPNSLQVSFPWEAVSKKVYHNSVVLTFWVGLTFKIHQQLGTWEKIDKIIVLNEHMKELFAKSLYQFKPDQLLVKPNFSTVPQNIDHKKKDYFLYVGRLIEEKGIEVMLKAFAGTPYLLKIAGDGPMKEEVQNLCRKYENLEYVGIVQKPMLFDLIAQSTALVFPSIWFEGMPLTIIESFACSTPVIASDLGAMKNMIRHGYNGLHFEAGNAKDLFDKIAMWSELSIEEKNYYNTNAQSSYRIHYTPTSNYQHLNSIYSSITSDLVLA